VKLRLLGLKDIFNKEDKEQNLKINPNQVG
jgi:hypothetical protein